MKSLGVTACQQLLRLPHQGFSLVCIQFTLVGLAAF
jgi:hypothetical protein